MHIATAQEHEIGAALCLVEELLAELGDEGYEYTGIDRGRLEADLGSSLRSGRFLALLARDESGAPVGVLTLSVTFALYAGGEYGVIDEMYVRPEHRGSGVGRALLESAIALARERGWRRLDVTGPTSEAQPAAGRTGPGETAGRAGISARRFYEREGFEFTGPKLRLLL